MAILSKRCLRFIKATISEFVDKGELVTSQGVDIDEYEKSLKKTRKMLNNLESNPEKYLNEDYFTEEMIKVLEAEAREWERDRHY